MATTKPALGLPLKYALPKRVFDIMFSLSGIIVFAPVIIVAWLIASIETGTSGIFKQKRVGLHGKQFDLFKIRTMSTDKEIDTTITSSNDTRITKSGAVLRNTKIDELPQLWNVLVGDMSFIGPRPDVPGYADELQGEDRVVLSIRPGITGPATLKYKNEEELLARQENPGTFNDMVIWPDKVRINREYINNFSFGKEFYYLWKTVFR